METQNLPTTSQSSNLPADPMGDVGMTGNLDASDINIPRLHLLQGLSEGVADGTYKMGDIIHTGDQKVLGGKDSPVVFIPFHIMKVNQKYRADVSPKEYICTEPLSGQEWEDPNYVWEQRDGTKVKCKVRNYRTIIVHGILPGDDDDMSLPVSITFKSSAGKNARAIVSHFATVAQFNQLKGSNNRPYNVAWELSSEHVKGDGQVFAKWVCKKSRKADDEEIEECDQWASAISKNTNAYAEHSVVQEGGIRENPQITEDAKQEQPNLDDIPF